MIELSNRALRIEVLDPGADAARLGPRYGWGGYVWQVHDRVAGPLLSGPEWPDTAPSAFNGQGLPESFRHRTLEGKPLTWRGEAGVALGAGELRADASGNATIVSPCEWSHEPQPERIVFTTRHAAAGYHYELVRTLALEGRTLRSITRLTNTAPATAAGARLTLEWFAHPFFRLVDGGTRAELPAGATLADNPGFVLNNCTLTQRRRFLRQDDGHMDRGLRLPPAQPLVATLAHPAVSEVRFETSFAPDSCVIWANDRTFSIEPYLTLDLAPGETREWSLNYAFGPA